MLELRARAAGRKASASNIVAAIAAAAAATAMNSRTATTHSGGGSGSTNKSGGPGRCIIEILGKLIIYITKASVVSFHFCNDSYGIGSRSKPYKILFELKKF